MHDLPAASKIAQAAAASGVTFDYVGSVTAGNVGTGEDEEDAFPGASIAQLQQHLVTDLPTSSPMSFSCNSTSPTTWTRA